MGHSGNPYKGHLATVLFPYQSHSHTSHILILQSHSNTTVSFSYYSFILILQSHSNTTVSFSYYSFILILQSHSNTTVSFSYYSLILILVSFSYCSFMLHSRYTLYNNVIGPYFNQWYRSNITCASSN